MRIIVIIGAGLLLAACQGAAEQKSEIEALQAKVTVEEQKSDALEIRVAALEKKTATAEAGSWVLWERRKLLQYSGPGFVSGPAPARPSDAFDTKEECREGGLRSAQSHGAHQGEDTWIETSKGQLGSTIDLVSYMCLPKGVPLAF